jgi:hypothetical protein
MGGACKAPAESITPSRSGVGGVSERPTRSSPAWSNPRLALNSAFATVEGVLVYRMAWSFVGSRRSVDLGRSVGWQRGSSPAGGRTDDSGRPEVAEGRERCPHARGSTHAPDDEMLEPSLAPADDTSFARSSDSCRSIVTSLSNGATRSRGGALELVSRSGKPGESQDEPAPGRLIVDLARLAASSPLPQGSLREASEKEGRHGARPCEDRKSSRLLPARRNAVAEVGRRRLVSKKLVKRAPKRAAGASERGPRPSRPTTVKRRGCVNGRNGESPPRLAPIKRSEIG